jgi:cytochrome P450
MTTTTATTTPSHVPGELVFDFDLYDMTGEADVYEKYRKLHDLPDIFWTPRYGGHWVAHRYDDQVKIFENPEDFSSRQQTIPAPPNGQFGLVMFDGDQHAAYRKLLRPSLIQPFLKPTEQGAKLDAYITQVAVSLIEGMVDRGECEFFEEFAIKLPVTVIMNSVLGLPMEDAPQLIEVAEAAARGGGHDQEKFMAAFAELAKYLMEKVIPAKRADPGNDAISAFVNGEPEGKPLTDPEIMIHASVIIFGALDTLPGSLAFTAWHLARHPEHRQRLIAEPELIPQAVEEFLRRYAVANMCRYVVRDMDFNGVRFAEGDIVYVPSTAAAIDDKHYPDAMEVDFDREDKKHLTFHRGPHQCVGALIARRELRIFLTEWLKRIPDFKVKPGEEIRMMTGLANRIVELPLVWEVPPTAG